VIVKFHSSLGQRIPGTDVSGALGVSIGLYGGITRKNIAVVFSLSRNDANLI
jgi:hypothetical protein